MKKTKKRTRSTTRGARKNSARMSETRIEGRKRFEKAKRRAELDPKTKRPKR